jgi:hypothetical protein
MTTEELKSWLPSWITEAEAMRTREQNAGNSDAELILRGELRAYERVSRALED